MKVLGDAWMLYALFASLLLTACFILFLKRIFLYLVKCPSTDIFRKYHLEKVACEYEEDEHTVYIDKSECPTLYLAFYAWGAFCGIIIASYFLINISFYNSLYFVIILSTIIISLIMLKYIASRYLDIYIRIILITNKKFYYRGMSSGWYKLMEFNLHDIKNARIYKMFRDPQFSLQIHFSNSGKITLHGLDDKEKITELLTPYLSSGNH